jgi:hypothetical protein
MSAASVVPVASTVRVVPVATVGAFGALVGPRRVLPVLAGFLDAARRRVGGANSRIVRLCHVGDNGSALC